MSKQYEVGFRLSTSGSAEVVRDVGIVGQGFERVGDLTDSIKGKVRDLALGLAGAFTIKEFVQTADEMALLDARLKLATKSEQEYAEARAATYRIAQENNVALEATSTLYTKLADPVRKLGGGVRETGAIVESFSAALRVGGASAAESSAATLQFAQAMASGALRGDEFNSIAEASPRFMRALAESLGVSTGELREMAEKGKLTADVVGNALVGSIGTLRAEAAKMPDTVGGAMTRLGNDVRLAVADINSNSGLTLGIAGLVDTVRQLVPTIKSELGGAFSSVGVWIERNREQIGEVWDAVKGLVGDVWAVAKAAGGVIGALWEWELQTGLVKTSIEGVRLAVALVRDGVELLAGYFAIIGSKILQGVLAPLNLVLKAAAGIAGVFDEEMASKIRGVSQGIEEFARAGENAGRQVFERFQDGKSHTAALGAELAATAAKNAQLKAALEGSGVSAAENSREIARLTANANAAAGGFTKLAGATKEDEEAKNKTAKAAQKLTDSFQDLVMGIRVKAAASAAEQNGTEKLNEAEKERLKVYEQLSGKFITMPAEAKAFLASIFDEWSANIKAGEASKAKLAAYNEELKVRGAVTVAALASADAVDAELKKQLEHNATIGLSKEALRQLELAKIDDALATAEQTLQNALQQPTQAELLITYADQVQALRALKKAKEEGITKELAVETASEWQKTTDSIFNGLVDSMYRGAESGKGIFSALGDTLKGMFRNLVLTPTIKAAFTGAAGTLGLPGTAAAGSAGTGSQGGGMSWLTNFGGSVADKTVDLAAFLGNNGFTNASAWLANNSSTIGQAAGTLGDIAGYGNALLAASQGKWGQAAGSAIGTYFGGPIGSAIGSAIGNAVDKMFGGGGGPKVEGGYASGAYRAPGSGAINSEAAGILAGIEAQYLSMVGTLGGTAGKITGATFIGKDPAGDALTQLVIDAALNGQQVYSRTNGGNSENVGRADGELGVAIADSSARAVLAALQASNIDADARAYLESKAAMAGSADDINKLLSTLVDVKSAFKDIDTLGGVFGRIASLSIDAKAQLLEFSGGVEAFLAKTKAYVDQYYSDGEKAAITANDVLARLQSVGISAADLTTKDSLRALVDGIDASTEDGRRQLAVLLDVAGEFAGISEYLTSQGKTLGDLAGLAPKTDLLAKLTAEGNSAQVDTGTRVAELGATTQAVGEALQSSIVTLDSNSATRNAELIATIAAQSNQLQELIEVQMTGAAQQVSGLANLRKTFEDLMAGNRLRVEVVS